MSSDEKLLKFCKEVERLAETIGITSYSMGVLSHVEGETFIAKTWMYTDKPGDSAGISQMFEAFTALHARVLDSASLVPGLPEELVKATEKHRRGVPNISTATRSGKLH